jgi:hypothetical protein
MIKGKKKIKKERCCFWISPLVHNHLRNRAAGGKLRFGKMFSIGDVIAEMSCNENADLVNLLENEEKVS